MINDVLMLMQIDLTAPVTASITYFDESKPDEFWRLIHDNPGDTALIYVHGFLNSFSSSIIEAAWLAWLLDFKGSYQVCTWRCS